MKGEPESEDSLASLTAIVPLDLEFRPKDLLDKARLMADVAQKAALKVIFAHNDRNTKHDKKLKCLLQSYTGISLVSDEFYKGTVNTALLRNLAFDKVTTEHLVLLDVDLWLNTPLLSKYLKKVKEGQHPFAILPCLYLSPSGSKALISGAKSPQCLSDDYFSFARKDFLHLANPSSIALMKSKDYKDLGGFDDQYSGHGYEDFDFLIRLASKYQILSPTPDFFTNTPARSPLFAQGFRRELGHLCLDALLDKDFFLHIFHPKNPESKTYYSLRQNNYSYFCERHKVQASGQKPYEPTLISAFIKKCVAQEKNIHDYSIYFENKPGHVDRVDTFRRRMKFLFQ